MKKPEKRRLGKKGELLAQNYLRKKGLKIIATNFRAGHGEIDIVALDGEVVVFAEVKSFQANPLGPPEFRVTKHQQKTIIRTAYAYLGEHIEFEDFPVRYDILIVDFSAYPARITHHEAAFWQDEPFF